MEKQKKSKIWIFHVLLFLFVFFVIFENVSYLFRPVEIKKNNIACLTDEVEDSLDLVAIGGSSTFVFWMPCDVWNSYGISSYNYSSDSMSPALMKNLIIECGKTQSPKLYLLDMRAFEVRERAPDFYTGACLRKTTDALHFSGNRFNTIRYAFGYEQPQEMNDPANYIDLMLYHHLWQFLGEDSYTSEITTHFINYKGFYYINRHRTLEERDYSSVTERKGILPDSEIVLRELLEFCRDNDVPALFTLNVFQFKDADTKAYYNYIEDIIHEYGFEFLDTNEYYDEMDIDFSTDFYDNNHVNILGAEKYSRFLADYIHRNYDLPDHRGEAAYSSWDKNCEAWKTDKEIWKSEIAQLIEEAS